MTSLDTETERQTRYGTTPTLLSEHDNQLNLANGSRRYSLTRGNIPTSSMLGGLDIAATAVGAIMVLAPLFVGSMGW